jgi:hypothetical protein
VIIVHLVGETCRLRRHSPDVFRSFVQFFSDIIGYKEAVVDSCEVRVGCGGFVVQMVIELFAVEAQTEQGREWSTNWIEGRAL